MITILLRWRRMKIRARCAFPKGIPVQAHSSKGIALTFLFKLAFGTL